METNFLKDNIYYIFDLDKTIWDCYDKNGNEIWAKQLVPPYTYNKREDTVMDDVYSICKLRRGVREYLNYLLIKSNKLGFISCGRYDKLSDNYQPSIKLLKLFEILDRFSGCRILEYKTYEKSLAVRSIEDEIIFYDDSLLVLDSLNKFQNVKTVNSLHILDWSKLIPNRHS